MRPYHDTEKQFHPIGRMRTARILFGMALGACAPATLAQLSGSLAALSDYRFRGRSLSEGQTTAQLTMNYDSDAGWYAGAMAAHARLEDTGTAQVVAYGGIARRLPGGTGWEAGATQTIFTRIGAENYLEGYVGISGEQASARVYYAPRYFGRPARTIYAEANGFLRLGNTLRLVGHAGLLRALDGQSSIGMTSSHRYDFRLGLAAHAGDFDVQLARVTSTAHRAPDEPGYNGYSAAPVQAAPQPRAFVLSAAYSF